MRSDIEKWRRIYRTWKKSGLSRKEFCRQKQLATSTFYYWQKIIKDTDEKSFSLGPRDLVKLPNTPSKNKNDGFILEFPGGYKLHIPQHCLPSVRKAMISELRDVLS